MLCHLGIREMLLYDLRYSTKVLYTQYMLLSFNSQLHKKQSFLFPYITLFKGLLYCPLAKLTHYPPCGKITIRCEIICFYHVIKCIICEPMKKIYYEGEIAHKPK